MIGDYRLTLNDVRTGQKFDDSIGKRFWPIEDWDIDNGLTIEYLEAPYDLPLASLKVAGPNNLWCAGDLTPITKPPVRWESELYSHAACSANCRGGNLPSELCGLTSL